jgi:hypothetical protein
MVKEYLISYGRLVFALFLMDFQKKKRRIMLADDRMTDWRNIVKDYVNGLPPERKVWPRVVSDKF